MGIVPNALQPAQPRIGSFHSGRANQGIAITLFSMARIISPDQRKESGLKKN
jgi:hypothetical protein